MQRHLSRLAKIAFFASCAAIPLGGLGCEKPQAASDRKVKDKVNEADVLMISRGRGDADAINNLRAAAKESDASPAAKIAANALLAQAEYNRALAARPKLEQLESKAIGLIGEIGDMVAVIGVNNTASVALAGREPGKSLEAFQKNLDAFKTQAAAADAKINELQKSLDAVNTRFNELEAKRSAAAAQAGSLMQQSEQASGQQAVDLYNKSLDARSQATTLGYQKAGEELKGVRLKTALAEAKQQKAYCDNAIKLTGEQMQQLTESGQADQKAIEERATASKAVLDSGSIAAKSKELAEAVTEADAQRGEIIGILESSAGHWQQAALAAVSLQGELSKLMGAAGANESPTYAAWVRLRDAYSSFNYNLGRGRSLQAAGDIELNEVRLLGDLAGLQKQTAATFATAKLTVPAELSTASKLEDARTAAKNQLTEADDSLSLAVGDRAVDLQPGIASEAAMLRVVVQYELYGLLDSKANLEAAVDALALFVRLNPTAAIPPLPPELEAKLPKRPPSSIGMTTPKVTPTTPKAPVEAAPPATPEGVEQPVVPDGAAAPPAEGQPAAAPAPAPAE